MKFAEEIWKKQLTEHLDRITNMSNYFELGERVKHYKIKRFMNKVFRTRFKLYEEKETTKKILGVTRPCIKN